MPKASWNIVDFSGGVNTIVDKRDIQDNESSGLDSLVAHNPGSLKLNGTFLRLNNYGNIGMSISSNADNIPITHVQPSSHFIKYGLGLASISGDTVTMSLSSESTLTTGVHPFSVNTIITIIKVQSGFETEPLIGSSYTIHETTNNSIIFNIQKQANGSSFSFSVHSWIFVSGADYVDQGSGFDPSVIVPYSHAISNNLILSNNGYGKFGFYNVGTKSFLGSEVATLDFMEQDQWLFDTKYLWNMNNKNKLNLDTLNVDDGLVETKEAMYIDGVVRVNEDIPSVCDLGRGRKPVGLYYIEQHKKFNYMTYYSGWYPLTTHCLSPTQHYKSPDSTNLATDAIFNSSGGIISLSASPTGSGLFPGQISIGVQQSSEAGDWQFASGNEHSKIGLGISLIYDNMLHKDTASFSQESSISKLTTSDGTVAAGTTTLLTIDGSDNRALRLYFAIKVGLTFPSGLVEAIYPSLGNTHAIPENRGSSFSGGDGNSSAWNPRIVGANVYITETNVETLSQPIWLATINFYGDESKYGKSYSHDGKESTSWSVDANGETASQSLLEIESPGIMGYYDKNGYKHNEQHEIWYKTSAIVNRKLYAGNVSYLTQTDPHRLGRNEYLSNFPDKILVSASSNKFDVFPIGMGLEIAKHDGQDIVKLLNFNNELLVFKTNDLAVIDCSGEDEIIKDIHKGKGISNATHLVNTSGFVYFCNKSGLYSYDGDSITLLSIGKFTSKYWSKNILSETTRLLYDEQYNLLIITTPYDPNLDDSNFAQSYNPYSDRCYIYNINNGSFFYKSELSNLGSYSLSNGINISGRLYAATSTFSTSSPETAIIDSPPWVRGKKAIYTFEYSTVTSGTSGTQINYDGDACQPGYLTTNMTFLKVYKAGESKWVTLNFLGVLYNIPFLPTTDQSTASTETGYNFNLKFSRDAISDNINSGDSSTSDYYVTVTNNPGNSIGNQTFSGTNTVSIRAYKIGAAYNIVPQDLSGISAKYAANGNVDSGKFGAMFSDVLTEDADASGASGQIGNIFAIKDFTDSDLYQAGTDTTGGVFDFFPDRNNESSVGSIYTITLVATDDEATYNISFTYQTGLNYWSGITNNPTGYTYLYDTSGTEAEKNDAIVSNFSQALIDGKITGRADNIHGKISMLALGAITTAGSSGSKYITLTLDDTYEIVNSKISWTPFFSVKSAQPLGALNYWVNDLPLDENGNSLLMTSKVFYETKDIDFGEPNVRKKVYKAYITYSGGQGHIKCYYQANQSGTWTAAEVFDSSSVAATNDNRLNSSTDQTRGELKFGTGGNNIYSFALKFESISSVTRFEINDVSIIYRPKRPK